MAETCAQYLGMFASQTPRERVRYLVLPCSYRCLRCPVTLAVVPDEDVKPQPKEVLCLNSVPPATLPTADGSGTSKPDLKSQSVWHLTPMSFISKI